MSDLRACELHRDGLDRNRDCDLVHIRDDRDSGVHAEKGEEAEHSIHTEQPSS